MDRKRKSLERKTVEDTAGSVGSSSQQTTKRRVEQVAKKCEYCESTVTLHWRDEHMICNECILKYNIGSHVPTLPPEDQVKTCLQCGETSTPQWMNGPMGPNTLCSACGPVSITPKRTPKKSCTHCESTETPQWREGPLGQQTLCNACGVQYRAGRLFPEYRPLKSPTYDPRLHSHLPKKVLEMRMREAEKSATSDACQDAV